MKTYSKNIVKAAFFAGLVIGAAQAADQPGDNYVSLMLGGIVPDSARDADTGIAGGSVTLGRVFRDHWNIEGQFGFLNIGGDSGKGGVDQDQIFFNANALNIYFRGGPVQPYLLGGLGYAQTSSYGLSDDNGFQLSVGGGAMVPMFDDSTRLRAELLGRFQSGDESYTDWLINLGISIPFGEKAEPMPEAVVVPAAVTDSDSDDVPDSIDRCPVSAANQIVDQYGCVLDTDSDGVPDELDRCWDTPLNTAVDASGCVTSNAAAPAAPAAPAVAALPALPAAPAVAAAPAVPAVAAAPAVPAVPAAVAATAVPLSGVIDLPGVNFRSNSNILLDGANTALDAAALILLDNPDINVEVAGHTDSDGDPVVNGTLSLARALVVRDYLIGVGVSPSRIRAHGYGDTEPLADNATEAGRATNRRVELRVKNRK